MRAQRRGVALILVLVATAGLFAMVLHASTLTRASALEAAAVRDTFEAERLARSAAVLAAAGLSTSSESIAGTLDALAEIEEQRAASQPDPREQSPFPSILEPLILQAMEEQGEQLEEQQEEVRQTTEGAGAPARGVRGGYSVLSLVGLPTRAFEWQPPGRSERVRVRLYDPAAQLRINSTGEEQLVRYLEERGQPASDARRIAQEILDWRDADDTPRPDGFDGDEYEPFGVEPRNGPIKSLDELLFLPSIDADLLDALRTDLSLGEGREVHAGSASRAVLMSVRGMTEQIADAIIAQRSSGTLSETELDTLVPPNMDDVRKRLRAKPGGVIGMEIEVVGAGTKRFFGSAIVGETGVIGVDIRPRM
ncbi:MAG: hypothetical protein AAGD00_01100 [Planctomycetota bacterium]